MWCWEVELRHRGKLSILSVVDNSHSTGLLCVRNGPAGSKMFETPLVGVMSHDQPSNVDLKNIITNVKHVILKPAS